MTNEKIPVPCGKCPNCLARRASTWSFRLLQEDKVSTSAYMLTLTYDTSTVPFTKNGFMDLSVRDVQLFIKRLRKAQNSLCPGDYVQHPIKYYCVGEYGTNTRRPHYHIILFNAQLDLVQPAWEKGQIHYGDVNGASIGYCLKYMSKPQRIPMHRNDDRTREFGLFSKGLGQSYLGDFIKVWCGRENKNGEIVIAKRNILCLPSAVNLWHKKSLLDRMYCNLPDGKKIAMARYYKDKIYNEHQKAGYAFHTKMEQPKREALLQKKGLIQTSRDKAEADKGSFDKMHYNSLQGRNKV